jgi:hypothetical protein
MLSKNGYLGDEAAGLWLPHVMFFLPHGQADSWGASQEGSAIIGQDGGAIQSTVLFIPVRSWSGGSPAPSPATKHPGVTAAETLLLIGREAAAAYCSLCHHATECGRGLSFGSRAP